MHNDYTLAREKLEISHNISYCSDIASVYGTKLGRVNKLVPNLGNENKYVIRYKNLQLYLWVGMKLVKVDKILQFKPSDWLKKYLDFNKGKRKHAASSFEKNFFKLINNNAFGKIMENLKKIINVRLVNNAEDYKNVCKQTMLCFTENI